MANPKWRHSKQRKRKRRTHYKIEAANVDNCKNCGAPRLSHHICGECGFYNGRIMIKKEVASTTTKEDKGPDIQIED